MKRIKVLLIFFGLVSHNLCCGETAPTSTKKKSLIPKKVDTVEVPKVAAPPAPVPPQEKKGEVVPLEETEKDTSEIEVETFDEPLQEAEKTYQETKPEPKKTLFRKEEKQEKPPTKEGVAYLAQTVHPWKDLEGDELVTMQFENADLFYLINFLESTFNITFILDDNIKPTVGKPLLGNKITFRSYQPLTKKQVWDIALTFLDMAGFAVVPLSQPRMYRIMPSAGEAGKPSANRESLPTFIGVAPSLLPDNDSRIRYVYFVENADINTIKSIVEAMLSPSAAKPLVLEPMKAIIMTDKASNIKSLMNIVVELDDVTMPEMLSVIKLKQADAVNVVKLYQALIQAPDQQAGFMYRPPKKSETTSYFSKNLRLIPEPRTNSIIALGPRDAIKRFEEFVTRDIDKEVDLPFSPLHVYQLKYLKATPIAEIINSVVKFQQGETAAQYGGVRGGEKYFRTGTVVTPEDSGNRLIINAPYEDYLKISEILEKMDIEQPQVAIKVFIVDVDITDSKGLGTQLRNKSCIVPGVINPNNPSSSVCSTQGCCGLDILGQNINFQTSSSAGINGAFVENTSAPITPGNGAVRLLGNLISLAGAAVQGSTLVTLGQDMYGVWGILQALQTFTRATVLANPFLIATHKYKSKISIGQTRRLPSAIVSGSGTNTTGFTDISANLEVQIVPQISYNDEMINLEILVTEDNFINANGDRTARHVKSNVLLANREVIALGGIVRDETDESESKVPILGDIPLFGWFFKNKTKTFTRSSILILICPEIIRPYSQEVADSFTQTKINDAKGFVFDARPQVDARDPINRWFFRMDDENEKLDTFISNQHKYHDESKRPVNAMLAMDERPRKSETGQQIKKKSILSHVENERVAA